MWYQRILITAKIFLLFINKYFIYRNIANIEKMTCSFMMILRCIVMIFASQKMIFPGKRGDLSQTKETSRLIADGFFRCANSFFKFCEIISSRYSLFLK